MSPASRTIGTSIDVNGRLFVPKIQYPQGFPRFFSLSTQVNLIPIYYQLTTWELQLRVYRGWINVCTTQNP